MSARARLAEIVREELGLDADRPIDQDRLEQDLGADSLDQIGMLVAIEEEYGVEITDDAAAEIATFADLVGVVDKALGQ